MKRFFVLQCLLLMLVAYAQAQAAQKEPEYLYLIFDREGRSAFSTMPGICMALHQSLSQANLVKLVPFGDARALLAESGFTGAPPMLLGSRIKDFAQRNEIKFLIAQSVEGRYDEGDVRLWLIEDGKVQVDGEKTPFSRNRKPPIGAVDTLLLTAMIVLEPARGDASALVEAEKFGTLESITQVYQRIGQSGVSYARWHLFEGIRAGREGKPDQAVKHAQMAVALDPFWPDNYETLGQFLKERGDRDQYLQALEGGLARYPDNLGLMMLLIFELDPDVDGLKMDRYLARAKKMDPDNAALIELEITLAVRKGNLDAVPGLMHRYYESESLTSNVRRTFALKIARDLMKQGKYTPASAVFAIVLKEDPQASIFLEKAQCHGAMGDLAGQLDARLAAFAQIPDENLVWPIVDGARDLNRTDPAIRSIRRTIEKMPGDPIPYTIAGLLDVLNGHLDASVRRFEQAMELSDHPRQAALYRLTAVAALGSLEQVEAAKSQYASEFEPPDMQEVVSLLVRLGAFGRAEPILTEMVKAESVEFEALFNLGLVSLAGGDPKGFKKAIKMGRRMEGKDPGKWGILLAAQYGSRKKDKDLEELLEGARKIELQLQKGDFKTCHCFSLIRYQVVPRLPQEQKRVLTAYLDFLRGDFGLGALANQLTE